MSWLDDTGSGTRTSLAHLTPAGRPPFVSALPQALMMMQVMAQAAGRLGTDVPRFQPGTRIGIGHRSMQYLAYQGVRP